MRDRAAAMAFIQRHAKRNEYVTGLIFIDETGSDMHAQNATTDTALNALPYERLHPGNAGLAKIMGRYR